MANRNGEPSALVAKVNLVMDFISLKVIFLLHFLVIVLALSCMQWLPQIYLYYNTFFFALLLWAIHTKERVLEPILMAAGIDLTAIVLDIICILSLPIYPDRRWFPFSLAFIILNIVLRPLTSFVLVRLYFAKSNCRGELPLHQESQNGSQLTNAIRKVLFLDPMSGGGDRRGVDPNGAYRAHVVVERKASAPLTSVKTVPNGPPATPPMFPPPPVTSVQVEIQPTISSFPKIESKQQQQSQFTAKPQTPTPQPRRPSEQQKTPSLTSSPQMSRQSDDLPAALPPSSSSMPIIPSILEQKEQKEKKSNPSTPIQSKRQQIVPHSSDSESGSDSDAEAIPEPGNLQLSQQRHSHYTDPSTGETFQERMI